MKVERSYSGTAGRLDPISLKGSKGWMIGQVPEIKSIVHGSCVFRSNSDSEEVSVRQWLISW